MPDDFASFSGPNGMDPVSGIKLAVQAMSTPTVGDQLLIGQLFRSRIRQRTATGVDANGAPFVPYSTKGPYYLYPNRDSSAGNASARATASRNRHAKTGGAGKKTPLGIKYESYAAAKAAHGVATVNEYGMEQHTHMLDTILVKVGGIEDAMAGFDVFESMALGGSGLLDMVTGEMSEYSHNSPATEVSIGFYGPEAERARGQNEGNSRTPKREFFSLNQKDLDDGSAIIAHRMWLRAKNPKSF